MVSAAIATSSDLRRATRASRSARPRLLDENSVPNVMSSAFNAATAALRVSPPREEPAIFRSLGLNESEDGDEVVDAGERWSRENVETPESPSGPSLLQELSFGDQAAPGRADSPPPARNVLQRTSLAEDVAGGASLPLRPQASRDEVHHATEERLTIPDLTVNAFTGLNFFVLPSKELLLNPSIFKTEHLRKICAKVPGLEVSNNQSRATMVRNLESFREVLERSRTPPTGDMATPVTLTPRTDLNAGGPVPPPMGDVPTDLVSRESGHQTPPVVPVTEGTGPRRPPSPLYVRPGAAQNPTYPPGFGPHTDPNAEQGLFSGLDPPASQAQEPLQPAQAREADDEVVLTRTLTAPTAPLGLASSMTPGFDIQAYVDSVLQRSMQEETKGVSNWLKAHRLRSELLDWCLTPGKSVPEIPKLMRKVAAAFGLPGASSREPETPQSLYSLATLIERELAGGTRDASLPDNHIALFAHQQIRATVPECEKDDTHESELQMFIKTQSKKASLSGATKHVTAKPGAPADGNAKCPKCQGSHMLRDCKSPYALNKDGSINGHEPNSAPRKGLLFFDGACRFNASPDLRQASFGVALCSEQGQQWTRDYGRLGSKTNNYAEFVGAVIAIQRAIEWNLTTATIVGDSELVVSAFSGSRNVIAKDLERLLIVGKAHMALRPDCVFNFKHVARDHNKLADSLANFALDSGMPATTSVRDPLAFITMAVKGFDSAREVMDGQQSLGPCEAQGRDTLAPSVIDALSGNLVPDPLSAPARDPGEFRVGTIHECTQFWDTVVTSSEMGLLVKEWAKNGVSILDFFQHFSGTYEGARFDSRTPPRMQFKNHAIPDHLIPWISGKIQDELRWGAIRVWGKEGECSPPHLVMPVGVEPAKPRKINDARFLNLWCKDIPFTYESVTMLPQILEVGDPAFIMDQANGFFHVMLTEESQQYMGFLWDGVYYVYTVLNFGWKLAPVIYSAFAGEFAGFIRRLGIPYLYYIDDNAGGPAPVGASTLTKHERAKISAFVVSSCMTAAGYFIHLEKTEFIPSLTITWLGIGIDLAKQEFFIPQKKWDKFLSLATDLRASSSISARDLERVAGKLVSMSIAAPGILIACRRLYAFLAKRHEFCRKSFFLNSKQMRHFKLYLGQLFQPSLIKVEKVSTKEYMELNAAQSFVRDSEGALGFLFDEPAEEWRNTPGYEDELKRACVNEAAPLRNSGTVRSTRDSRDVSTQGLQVLLGGKVPTGNARAVLLAAARHLDELGGGQSFTDGNQPPSGAHPQEDLKSTAPRLQHAPQPSAPRASLSGAGASGGGGQKKSLGAAPGALLQAVLPGKQRTELLTIPYKPGMRVPCNLRQRYLQRLAERALLAAVGAPAGAPLTAQLDAVLMLGADRVNEVLAAAVAEERQMYAACKTRGVYSNMAAQKLSARPDPPLKRSPEAAAEDEPPQVSDDATPPTKDLHTDLDTSASQVAKSTSPGVQSHEGPPVRADPSTSPAGRPSAAADAVGDGANQLQLARIVRCPTQDAYCRAALGLPPRGLPASGTSTVAASATAEAQPVGKPLSAADGLTDDGPVDVGDTIASDASLRESVSSETLACAASWELRTRLQPEECPTGGAVQPARRSPQETHSAADTPGAHEQPREGAPETSASCLTEDASTRRPRDEKEAQRTRLLSQVTAFVQDVVQQPSKKLKVMVGEQEARHIVKRVTQKVMDWHADALSDGFLITQGDSVRSLVHKYMEHKK
ncbi:hypothetical protein CYMTET_52615 [Cymbomonas tetramitiformis]|uniref:RNase H type-1 domain-containing protein n=1 Tax=Cymbomonas tetramitiformis TaxID=36881 RepID=A0AAE0BKI6_9CHLO|nr:hypothetical protein CYMTET_52615 [Cymbomonas tetramitiformis]